MKRSILYFIGAIFLFGSCAKDNSENVNQDSIYTIYELFYNETSDKTWARATFRFGGPTGTLLDLDDPAVVTFNGDELLYGAVSGMHNKEYAGFTNSGSFSYTDLDNNTYNNTTPTITTVAFPTVDTINSSGAYTFIWTGTPLVTGETMKLTIDGTQQGNWEFFSTSVTGATEIVLSASKLQNLGIGDANCTLQRTYNQATVDEGPTEGGRMALWYETHAVINIQ